MRRQSEVDFLQQMGFDVVDPDHELYVALMFQPRIIACLIAAGVLLQSGWLFLALSAVLWWATVFPTLNPFDAAYDRLIAIPRGLRPIPEARPPRRFAQAMAGGVALIIGTASIAGAPLTALMFEGLFAIAVTSVVVGRLCAPARLYMRLAGKGHHAPSVARRA